MEPAEYWMWAKRKQGLSSHSNHHDFQSPNSNYDDSWEEQAFAVDAAGSLGGCIWPPRSYSCSFCKREFRSAQALGGHMNVHRRDRARLKQSPNSQINDQPFHQDQNKSSFSSLGFQYPSKFCDSSLIQNPNPSSNNQHAFTASPSSSSRVSAATASQQILNCQEKTLFLPFYASIVEGNSKKTSSSSNSSPQSWSNFVTERYHRITDLKDEGKEKSRNVDQEYPNIKGDQVKTDLSVSLNLVFRQTHSVLCDGKEKAQINCKRRKTEASLLPLFLSPSSIDRHHHHQLEEDQHRSPSSIEDLDLELRLGDPPKVE